VTAGRGRVYDYRIDEQGAWFCQGNPVTDQDLHRLLSRSLFRDEGGYFIRCQGEVHPVAVADAPLLIAALESSPDGNGGLAEARIRLSDGRVLRLDGPLLVSAQNVLYARLGRRKLLARFARQPFYELTRYLERDGRGYFVRVGGRRLDIEDRDEGQG